MDKLSSAILPAILAGGAALAGQGDAALGAALGGLEAPVLLAKEENQARREQLEDILEREENQLQRIDRIHSRMNQLVVANPDAFVDPDTGEMMISEEMLGFLTSGQEGLPLNVTTKRVLESRNSTRGWKERLKLVTEGVANAGDRPAAERFAWAYLDMLGMPQDELFHQDVVNALWNPDEGDNKAVQNLITRADPDSVVYALAWMSENGYTSPSEDPVGFASQLTFEAARRGPRVPLKEEMAARAVIQIRDFMGNIDNQEFLEGVWNQHGRGSDQATKAIVEEALFDQPELRDAYTSYLSRHGREGLTPGQLLALSTRAVNNTDAISLYVDDQVAETTGITREDVLARALGDVGIITEMATNAQETDTGASYAQLTLEIQGRFRESGFTVSRATAAKIWDNARKRVRADRNIDEGTAVPFQAVQDASMAIVQELIAKKNQNQ
jgi:hypothetical protein